MHFSIWSLPPRRLALGLLLVVGIADISEASSGEVLEEVIVTASLRQTPLLETASSVTVLDQQQLADAAQQHLAEVLALVPNLNWSSGTSRPRYLQIRGIGERSQYEGAPNPSVGFLVDDIDFSSLGGVATLFDTEQVEVLRGPQGTRYGANALGGLVYVRTAAPSAELEQRLEFSAGDDDLRSLAYARSGPLTPTLGYRLAVQQFESNGFIENRFLDRDDTNNRDELTARLKLSWQPGEHWQLDLTGLRVELDNGFDAFAVDQSIDITDPDFDPASYDLRSYDPFAAGFVTQSDQPGRDRQDSTGLSLRAEYDGLSAARILSISSFADSDILYSFDGDWGNPQFWGAAGPYDFFSATARERRTLSQELRLLSKPSAALFGGNTDWLLGLYSLRLDEENVIEDVFNDTVFRELTSDYRATNTALFGQLDSTVSARDSLSFGLRVEHRNARYRDYQPGDCQATNPAGFCLATAADPSETMLGGRLAWQRSLDENRSVYLALSRGYKAGGFNIGSAVPEQARAFDAEFLWNLEAGLKGIFWDGALQAQLAVFAARRDDVQTSVSFQLDPTNPNDFVFVTANAAEGDNYGLEAEASWRLTPQWRAFGSFGWLETKITGLTTIDRRLDGREQAHAPNYQFALGLDYRHPDGWFGRVDLTGKDEYFFSDSHDEVAPAYELVNLKLGFEATAWSAYLWGRNLTDEDYATRGFFFSNDPRLGFPEQLFVQRGDPRQVGATLKVKF